MKLTDGEARGKRSLFEEFRRNVVPSDAGLGHEKQTPAGPIPAGHVSAVRRTETLLPSKLALFPGHVFVASEKSRPASLPSCIRCARVISL